MKTIVLTCLAIAAVLSFSACTTVEDQHTPVHTSTTTTEETTVHHPVQATTETHTTRTY